MKKHYIFMFIVVMGILILTDSFLITAGVLVLLLLAIALINQRRHRQELQRKLDEKRQN
ncbi:MAG: hypothetical protein KBS65_02880 [Prevotella sp.]|nr:hypothetical protein [Candidatus Equicola stercoris]